MSSYSFKDAAIETEEVEEYLGKVRTELEFDLEQTDSGEYEIDIEGELESFYRDERSRSSSPYKVDLGIGAALGKFVFQNLTEYDSSMGSEPIYQDIESPIYEDVFEQLGIEAVTEAEQVTFVPKEGSFPDSEVMLDGESIGRTDDNGELDLSVITDEKQDEETMDHLVEGFVQQNEIMETLGIYEPFNRKELTPQEQELYETVRGYVEDSVTAGELVDLIERENLMENYSSATNKGRVSHLLNNLSEQGAFSKFRDSKSMRFSIDREEGFRKDVQKTSGIPEKLEKKVLWEDSKPLTKEDQGTLLTHLESGLSLIKEQAALTNWKKFN
jgi:hypothetical protein